MLRVSRRRAWSLFAGSLFMIGGVGRLIDFPGNYIAAQSSSANSLATGHDWEQLHEAALRDIVFFVPAYLVVGIALAWMVIADGRRRSIVVGLLVAGGIADWVETALFRNTLGQLIDGVAAEELGTQTTVTLMMSVIKYAALVAAVGLTAYTIARDR